ncbi:hypothetical protein KSP40_PGU008597 [Platanthera guangdongensis]|uniref:Uncharacterized protein n=1 Tax=Platanthera guangdongensis TaxID=2320717 RepID=A0ABR2N2G4_9ASPA
MDQIIGDPRDGVRTHRGTTNENLYLSFLSQVEPKKFEEVNSDASCNTPIHHMAYNRRSCWNPTPYTTDSRKGYIRIFKQSN